MHIHDSLKYCYQKIWLSLSLLFFVDDDKDWKWKFVTSGMWDRICSEFFSFFVVFYSKAITPAHVILKEMQFNNMQMSCPQLMCTLLHDIWACCLFVPSTPYPVSLVAANASHQIHMWESFSIAYWIFISAGRWGKLCQSLTKIQNHILIMSWRYI